MSLGELVAWQAGIDWARAGLTKTAFTTSSVATLTGLLDQTASDCLRQLGRDVFAHWFCQGLSDFQAIGRV